MVWEWDYDWVLLTYQVGLNAVIFSHVIPQVHREGAVSSLQAGGESFT